jgi:hypothetical protein
MFTSSFHKDMFDRMNKISSVKEEIEVLFKDGFSKSDINRYIYHILKNKK